MFLLLLNFQGHAVKGQIHAATTIWILWTLQLVNRWRGLNQNIHKYLLHLEFIYCTRYLRFQGHGAKGQGHAAMTVKRSASSRSLIDLVCLSLFLFVC